MDKSKERAHQIIARHIESIKRLRGLVKSVVLVGSLSDDTYTGNAGSDIDLIHVLNDDAAADAGNIIRSCISQTEAETGNDIPISRCVYFYKNLLPPYKTDFELCADNKDMVELPIEIFRMKDSGRIIYGEDIIGKIPVPTRNDVLLFHNISKSWNKAIAEQDPERYKRFLQTAAAPPIRLIAQSVLTGAMTHYYFYTGDSCSSKAKIYEKVKTSIPDYRFIKLLKLSHKWRFDPENVDDDEKAFMLKEYQVWYETRLKKPFDFVPTVK
ncbi:MAG: nucleotidyltransferase domain-containing protein [Oscillospiraceae bacterium]|jgi:hypothetical protein|nr:nucleotidyltransferase domain-containing protein [Oscillospiraceae bacterium]